MFGRIAVFLLLSMLTSPLGVRGDAQSDRDRAEQAAVGFLRAFDRGDLRPAYREQVGKSFKQTTKEEAFVAQFSIVRSQLGGPGSNRQVIDERALSQLPNTPLQGTFYFFRYKARHPVGSVYEDVYMEKEGDGAWRLVGSWFYPAPD
jgi:hypothetical protein